MAMPFARKPWLITMLVFSCNLVLAYGDVAVTTDAPTSHPSAYIHSVITLKLSAGDRLLKKRMPESNQTSLHADPNVVTMAQYVVTSKEMKLTGKDVLSEKAAMQLLKKKYTSPLYQATFGQLSALGGILTNPLGFLLHGWHPNDAEASALYEDDQRKAARQRLAELNWLDHGGR